MDTKALIEKEKESSWLIYRRILRYLEPYKKKFGFALVCMVVYGATEGVIPFFIRDILDKVFSAGDEKMLWLLPVILIIFASVRAVFGFFQQYLSAQVGLSIVKDIRDDIASSLMSLSPGFYLKNQTGSLLSRVTNDTLFVRQALTDAVTILIKDFVRVVALVIAAVSLDPVLGAISFIVVPLAIYPVIRFGKKVRKLSRSGQNQFGELTALLSELILGNKVVQTFDLKERLENRFKTENLRLTKTFIKSERYGAFTAPTNDILASVGIALVIFYGGFSVISGTRTQGQFIAFLIAVLLMYDPIKRLGKVNNIIQTGLSASERIFEILDTEPDIKECENPKQIDAEGKKISYDDVWLQYDGSAEDEFALQGVSFTLEPGQTLALVGESGGGKSSLANLLPRLYDPTKGSIKIGGEDLRDLSLSSLRKNISVVDQSTFLFNDTVFNNIQLGRPDATREEVIAAAEAANAKVFIDELPEGFDTEIGEQGLRLSGGQRARISIARALLRNSPILILDEATAALDSESEILVQAAIEKLMAGRTVVAIAHRLATIRNADMIIVIEGGKVVETGSHKELLGLDGRYSKLHGLQFSESITPERLAN